MTKSNKKKPKSKKKDERFVRITNIEIFEKVHDHKDKTGVPIGRFFELGAAEKLERDS